MPSILVTDSQTLLPAGLATALLADGTPQCETFELNGSWCPGVIKATLNQLPQPKLVIRDLVMQLPRVRVKNYAESTIDGVKMGRTVLLHGNAL